MVLVNELDFLPYHSLVDLMTEWKHDMTPDEDQQYLIQGAAVFHGTTTQDTPNHVITGTNTSTMVLIVMK